MNSLSTISESRAGPSFELLASRQFTGWLAEQRVSLAFTTYQTGKLFLVGRKPDEQLAAFERNFIDASACGPTGRRCG